MASQEFLFFLGRGGSYFNIYERAEIFIMYYLGQTQVFSTAFNKFDRIYSILLSVLRKKYAKFVLVNTW